MFKKVVIAGVGLMGGSLGMAMVKGNMATEVVGVDPDRENLKQAVRMGAVHRAADLAEALPGTDLLILATPIGVTLGVLEMAIPYLTPGTIITDIGSVKGRLVERAEAMLPSNVHFVGGHPMAGLELTGVVGAREDLFEGAAYIITPTPLTNPTALERIKGLIEKLGAKPIELGYLEHDGVVAFISHLPHLLAATLVNTIANEPEKELLLNMAAGGFRDTTRIAASNSLMWRDILLTNREMVLQAITRFRSQLEEMEKFIKDFNAVELVKILNHAKGLRESLPENRVYMNKCQEKNQRGK
ncbi:prephenate dehydrogenase [Desulforamulus reducens MI-1]|uniref:Prephenate dehydrogenase n=1 Tax=Desulforamulus reducens (strain ATCC BAA-1160 / DSM 100696 / MI-1) TaxID=349161 RepID=A4J3N1_DESRM|nr:prephenate dehydrogenase [Desulforamulus reducens]ABO49684.1 prephenate dehydrogenase [Desulforamulus reducens MI-1]